MKNIKVTALGYFALLRGAKFQCIEALKVRYGSIALVQTIGGNVGYLEAVVKDIDPYGSDPETVVRRS